MIGEEREVWIGERVAAIEMEKTWSKQAKVAVKEDKGWIVTSLAHPSPAGP